MNTVGKQRVYSRGVRAELAAQRVALVGRDLGLGDELSDLVSHDPRKVPYVAVPLEVDGCPTTTENK